MADEDRQSRLQSVPVGKLKEPREPFRQPPEKEEIDRLAESIRKHGLLHPILARPAGRDFEIISGVRRVLACKAIGLGRVPVVVRAMDDRTAFETAVVENARRTPLNSDERQVILERLGAFYPGRDPAELETWLGPDPSDGDGVAEVVNRVAAGSPLMPPDHTPVPGVDGGETKRKTLVRRRRLVIRVRSLIQTLDDEGRLDMSLLEGIIEELFGMLERLDPPDFLDLRYWESPQRYVPRHCLNVAKLAVYVGRDMGLKPEELQLLATAALLHDVGMMRVKDTVFTKVSSLDQEEWEKVKDHPIEGALLLTKEAALLDVVGRVALEHHEKPDGSGYPSGKKGDEMHLFARLINVVDTFEAICSPRPHRLPLLPAQAMQIVMDDGSKGTLDWDIVKAFLRVMSIYPVGSFVRLGTGEIARVVQANPDTPPKPVLAVIADERRNMLSRPRLLDMAATNPPPTVQPIAVPF